MYQIDGSKLLYCLMCGEISIHVMVDGSASWHKLFRGQFSTAFKTLTAHTLQDTYTRVILQVEV